MTLKEKGKTTIETRLSSIYGVLDTAVDGINLYSQEDVVAFEQKHGFPPDVMLQAHNLLDNRPKNTFRYICLLQSSIKRLISSCLALQALTHAMQSELGRMDELVGERNRKRWTPEEDELLIERAARDGETTVSLSRAFGRTPGAIQTRISYLVGINRLSQNVAGRFVGTVDGKQVEGNIDGVVTKTSKLTL